MPLKYKRKTFLSSYSRRKKANREAHPLLSKQVDKKVATSTGSALIVLRYMPKSRRKYGESSFSGCTIPNDITKDYVKCGKVNLAICR